MSAAGPHQRPEGAALRAAIALEARLKLGAAVAFLALALGGPSPAAPLLVAGLGIAAALALGCGREVWHLLRSVALLAALAAAIALLTRAAPATALLTSARLAVRCLAGAAVFKVLSATTPPQSMGAALRSLRLPEDLVQVLALSQRYVSVLGDAARTGREAQLMRGGYRGIVRSARSAGELGGLALLRAFSQAEATSAAVEARGGWAGLLAPPSRWRAPDSWAALALAAVALLIACLSVISS